MTPLSLARRADEPSVEVTIETSRRMPVPAYTSILSQVAWSLDEIDRSARPGKAKRVEWGIVEVEGSSTIRALLAPIVLPPKVEAGSVQVMANGLVNGLHHLDEAPEIPRLFNASTVRRIERVGSAVQKGRIDEVRVASLNGSRQETVVTQRTYANAHQAITGKVVSLGSVQGILDVLDARHRSGVRGQIYLPSLRQGVMVRAKPEQASLLKEHWGSDVVASGQLHRNSRGQLISVELADLVPVPERQHISPWSILGSNPRLTGDSTTSEYLEMIRGR